MKSIIKIAVCIIVALSSISLQSCKKEATEIAPVNTSIVGTWSTVLSSAKTLERQFIKGSSENAGTGFVRTIVTGSNGSVTVTTSPFNWDIDGNFLHIENVADVGFFFEITANGERLILFDEVNRNEVSFTFDRIN